MFIRSQSTGRSRSQIREIFASIHDIEAYFSVDFDFHTGLTRQTGSIQPTVVEMQITIACRANLGCPFRAPSAFLTGRGVGGSTRR